MIERRSGKNEMSANLRHEGAALAAMGQELAGLIDIAPRIELDHLDIETGHGRGQSARDFHRLRRALVLDLGGGFIIEAARAGPAGRPRELGRAVAFDLLAKGAAEIIERSRPK